MRTPDPHTLADYDALRPETARGVFCWGPDKNMYLGHFGEVVACCNNRDFILGHWPEKSLMDIWSGKNFQKLRQAMARNDLSLGCHQCARQLESGNWDAIKSRVYDYPPLNENAFPATLELELSNHCNLECVMCRGEFSSRIRKNRENLPGYELPWDGRLVEELLEFLPHLHEIRFFGGEPFLIDLYYDIWEAVVSRRPDLPLSVQTNATVLNDRIKSLMHRGRFQIGVSLDGSTKETYESIRQGARFDQVMKNLQWFAGYAREKGTYFGLCVCPMPQNWFELANLVRLANDLEASLYFHTVWFPAQCSLRSGGAAFLWRVFHILSSLELPEDTPIQKRNKVHFHDMLKDVRQWALEAEIQQQEEGPLAGLDHSSMEYLEKKLENRLLRLENKDAARAAKRLERLRGTMKKVQEALPGDYPLGPVLEQVAQGDMDSLISNLESQDVRRLVRMAVEAAGMAHIPTRKEETGS